MKISVNTSSKKELFNDLKIKFMLLASVIGTAILLIIFIAIFSAQYGDMHLNIKESLYSTIDDFKNFSGAGSEFDDFDARNHCILLVERNGVIVIKQHFDGYTQTEQSQIINVVTNTDKTKVTIGKRHFQILKASSSNFVFDETVYAIYDYTMEYNSIMIKGARHKRISRAQNAAYRFGDKYKSRKRLADRKKRRSEKLARQFRRSDRKNEQTYS